MKNLASMVTTLMLLITTPAIGEIKLADQWRTEDTVREVVFLGLWFIDTSQGHYIAEHPDRYGEQNVLLGKHPSKATFNQYFIGCALSHLLVSALLPPDERTVFQVATIGMEIWCVNHNYFMGIEMSW